LNKDRQQKIYYFPCIILLLTSSFLLPTSSFAQAGWTPDMRLTFRQGIGFYPRAACCGDTIHLVWWQAYISHDEIFYKRSTDAGMTWGNDTVISKEDTIGGYIPTISVAGNNIHVAWYETGAYYHAICYRRSTDGGETWNNIDTIMKASYFGISYPWICVNKNILYLVAASSANNGKLMFSKSIDNGNNWTDSIAIASFWGEPRMVNPTNDSLFLFIVYRDSNVEISSIRSFDGGASWSVDRIISDYDTIASQQPALTIDDNFKIHITWYDYKYSPYSWTGDIFYRSSPDSGTTWWPIESLTSYHRAVYSDIIAISNTLYLVWDDNRNGPNSNFEIYYRLSTDLGQTWLPEVRLTDADSNSTNPSLATDGNYLHLFWMDNRDTNYNSSGAIYYKRKNWLGISEAKQNIPDNSSLFLSCPTIVKGNFPIRYNLGDNKSGTIALIDLTGRTINIITVDANRKEDYIIIKKEVANGLYFLMLKAGINHQIKKVVVIR